MSKQSKLRRGEGSVSPYTLADGTERWRARWYDDTKARSRSFDSEKAAHNHLVTVGTDKRLGRYIQAADMTVADGVARYLKRGAKGWSTNTSATYGQIARAHIIPYIGKVRVADVTTSRIQHWVDKLESKGLSASVIGNARIILSGMFAEMLRMKDVSENPVIGVRMPSKSNKATEIWDEAQVAAVISAAHDINKTMEVYYRVSVTTGMRPGEVRALMWKDIDFDAGIINCRRTITRDANFKQIIGSTTKTDKTRSIAVPASTINALQAQRRRQLEARLAAEKWEDNDLVFERGNGTLLPQQTLRNRHEAVCKAAGVPQIRMHGLRHTAATLLLRRGIHPKIVSDILGHSSIAITLDLYTHTDVSIQRAATDILGEIAK